MRDYSLGKALPVFDNVSVDKCHPMDNGDNLDVSRKTLPVVGILQLRWTKRGIFVSVCTNSSIAP